MLLNPLEEEQRLAAVANLGLLDRPEDERFGRITRLVQRHFRCSACSITLVDRDRQFFISQRGLASRETSREESVCALVVENKAPLIISDLRLYEKTKHFRNLLDLKLVFYAGIPIWSPEGWPVGTLCVLDRSAREFSNEELESLQDFAALVEDEILMRRVDRANFDLIAEVERLRLRAFIDALTGVWNRGALSELLQREWERARRGDQPLSIAMVDLDFFKRVNDTHGHLVGDEVLKELCSRLKSVIRPYDAVGRYGGEEFVVVFPGTSAELAVGLGERLRAVVAESDFVIGDLQLPITISVGLTTLRGCDDSVEDMLERADQALYAAKGAGRNRVMSG